MYHTHDSTPYALSAPTLRHMKSYHADSGAGLAGLTLKEHDVPPVGPREILIRVRANSLNFRELSVLRGTYPLPVKPDVIMGADGAGEVIECGTGVTRVRTGDRVAVAMFPRWIDGPIDWEYAPQIGGTLDGMLTELVAIHEDGVVKIPEHLSFEEAATLSCGRSLLSGSAPGGDGSDAARVPRGVMPLDAASTPASIAFDVMCTRVGG